jgi:hypothetical protein
MFVNTGYTVDNENYEDKDLSTIFQPINNYDYGTYKIYANNLTNLNTYNGFYNEDEYGKAGQSFTIYTPRNVVSPEFNFVEPNECSFLRFSKNGIYRLDMTFNVESGYVTAGGLNVEYSLTNYIKIDVSNNFTPENVPTIDIINMSFSGNGATNQNSDGFTSSNNNNNIYAYSSAPTGSANAEGYPVFYTLSHFSRNGIASSNTHSLSLTFKISTIGTQSHYDIYPLLAGNAGSFVGEPWLIEGNWMVTKLS